MNTINDQHYHPGRCEYQFNTSRINLSNLKFLYLIWRQRTKDRQALRSMENHILKDIGLTYVDVELEVKKPFWRS